MKNMYIEKIVDIENSEMKEVWLSNHYIIIRAGVLDKISQSAISLIIPNPVKRICNGAFNGCENLISVSLPDSLCSIGHFAFGRCRNLKSITIPSNLTDIKDSVFWGCWGLESVTILGSVLPNFHSGMRISSINIGENLKEFNNGAFNSKQIKSIVVDKNNKYLDSRNNCNAVIETQSDTLIFACNRTKIPEGIKHIGGGAFGNCGRMRVISLPISLESILSLPENVKKIIIPKGSKQKFKNLLHRTDWKLLVEQ